MRLTGSKLICFCVVLFSLFSFACGQTEVEKIKLHNQYTNTAYDLREQGELLKAIEYQQKAVELFPKNADTLAVLAGMYMKLYEQTSSKKELEKAKDLLLKASKIKPNDVVIYKMLAGVFDMSGNEKETLKYSQKAVELQPENLESLTNLGTAQNSVENNDVARAIFEKVLQKNPNYAYALYHYAELELETGNKAKALKLFERGSKASESDNEGNTKYIEICRQRLEELKNEKAKTASPK